MSYEASISWLFEQFPAYHLQGVSAYKPSLDNIRAMAAYFGNPHEQLSFVHVAGTNGKGSVSNMLAAVLTESGQKTGLFTSPHIFDFRERIRVNGVCIDEAYVIDFCEQVKQHNWDIAPSFFEITWLMALCYFRDHSCAIIVAETGLGGRLDATNIITPLLSVITNISLDHTNILGSTKAAIAGEKAGIIKPGIPVVIGTIDPETHPVFQQKSQETSSNLYIARGLDRYPEGIFGYQRQNYNTVVAAIEQLRIKGMHITEEQIALGIQHLYQHTGFVGRLQTVATSPTIIIDCAHNTDGIRETIKSMREIQQGKLHILYGTSADKNLESILEVLPGDAQYYVTTFSNPRSAQLQELTKAFYAAEKKAVFFENPLEAFSAMKQAASKEDTLLITGSFFLVSEFFPLFLS